MGHIFGLYHTFHESEYCVGEGDYIQDTPTERFANENSCNVKRDTCPNRVGNDPVRVSQTSYKNFGI